VVDFLGKVRATARYCYLADEVLLPKLLFKLRFERFDDVQRDVTNLLLQRAKLNERVNRLVRQAPPDFDGLGWPRWVDRVYATDSSAARRFCDVARSALTSS